MHNGEIIEIKNQVAHYQYTADALCDLRTDVAPLLAQHVIANEEYQSWGMVGLLGTLYATDKLDGYFASKRASLIAQASDTEKSVIESDEKLMQAIAQGGRKDDKADKTLTHAIFLSIAVRESCNTNVAYGLVVAGSDAIMYGRDKLVGYARDKAEAKGKKGDARKLGKYKQGLLVATALVAVAPINSSKEKTPAGRKIVAAGMIGGVILSIASGIDQIRSLKSS